MKNTLIRGLIALSIIMPATAETLRVLNWSDYIDETILETFEERFQVEIEYVSFDDEFDFIDQYFGSAESFDVIFPSDGLLNFLISRDLLTPINKARITHYDQLSPEIMAQLSEKDPRNTYAIPYLWGTTGIGLNKTHAPSNASELIEANGWGVLFDGALRQNFTDCGIATVYEREEIFAAALRYLGYSINTVDENALLQASMIIGDLVQDVRYMHSERYYEEIATGEICLALGYSGDILFQVMEDETESVQYFIPNQGASMWFDVIAIPKSSDSRILAHKFIDFLTQPQQAALNTEYNAYPNPLPTSQPWIDDDILTDPAIYPPAAVMNRLEAFTEFDKKSLRFKRKHWVKDVCSQLDFCVIPLDLGY